MEQYTAKLVFKSYQVSKNKFNRRQNLTSAGGKIANVTLKINGYKQYL